MPLEITNNLMYLLNSMEFLSKKSVQKILMKQDVLLLEMSKTVAEESQATQMLMQKSLRLNLHN